MAGPLSGLQLRRQPAHIVCSLSLSDAAVQSTLGAKAYDGGWRIASVGWLASPVAPAATLLVAAPDAAVRGVLVAVVTAGVVGGVTRRVAQRRHDR